MNRLGLLALLLARVTHPLHYSQTTITAGENGQVAISIETEVDDIQTAITTGGLAAGDSGLATYVRSTVTLSDGTGRPFPLAWKGSAVDGTTIRLQLQAQVPGDLAQARLRQAMHTELFSDQVNVVLVQNGARRLRLLFTPGSGPRRLS
jgi:hypothetical protein